MDTDTTIPVTLASFEGSITDSTGQPLAGQDVILETTGGTEVVGDATNKSGFFAVTAPPGVYDVDLSGSVGDPTTYNVTVPGVNLDTGMQVALELPTESTTVKVTGPTGQAVANATVSVPCTATSFTFLGGTASGSECAMETTNASGQAAVTLLGRSRVTVTVDPPTGSGLLPKKISFVPSNGRNVTVQLALAPATVTWATPAAITYGTALGPTQLDAKASVPGTFSYSPVAGTVLKAGVHTLRVTFTPTDTADYSVVIATVKLVVDKAKPGVTWATPAAITYGTALGPTQLDAKASVPGTCSYSPAAGTAQAARSLGVRAYLGGGAGGGCSLLGVRVAVLGHHHNGWLTNLR
jgi:hypothetical protein